MNEGLLNKSFDWEGSTELRLDADKGWNVI